MVSEDLFLSSGFLLEIVVCSGFMHLFLSYYRSKPILHQSLADLLYCDLCFIYGLVIATGNGFVFAYHTGIMNYFPDIILLAWAWLLQLFLQLIAFYLTHPTVFRYVIIYKKRMILTDYEDGIVINWIRSVSIILSGGICLNFILQNKDPILYYVYHLEKNELSIFMDSHYAVIIMLAASAVVNIILRVLIFIESSVIPASPPEGQTSTGNESFKAALMAFIIYLLVSVLLWLTFFLGDRGSDLHGFSKRLLALQLNNAIMAPLAMVCWNPDIKRFVKKYLKGLIIDLGEALGMRINNSVCPA